MIDKKDVEQLTSVLQELVNKVARIAHVLEEEYRYPTMKACTCCGYSLIEDDDEICPCCNTKTK